MNAKGVVCLLSLVIAAGSAVAEPVKDDATGLVVQAPDGYQTKKTEGDPRYAVVFAVQKGGEEDAGCKVAFQAAPQNASLTQEEINAFTQKKEWIDLIRATLALRYDVAKVEPFEQAGLAGAAVTADFKPVENQPQTSDVRSYLVLIDTPKGRTTVVCVANKASFEERRPEFEAIARAVSPPR